MRKILLAAIFVIAASLFTGTSPQQAEAQGFGVYIGPGGDHWKGYGYRRRGHVYRYRYGGRYYNHRRWHCYWKRHKRWYHDGYYSRRKWRWYRREICNWRYY